MCADLRWGSDGRLLRGSNLTCATSPRPRLERSPSCCVVSWGQGCDGEPPVDCSKQMLSLSAPITAAVPLRRAESFTTVILIRSDTKRLEVTGDRKAQAREEVSVCVYVCGGVRVRVDGIFSLSRKMF